MRARLRAFGATYTKVAIVLCNFIVVLLVLNLGAGATIWLRDRAEHAADRGSSGPPGRFKLFRDDGAPLATWNTNEFQLRWFDYTGMTEVSEEAARSTLVDFDRLASL